MCKRGGEEETAAGQDGNEGELRAGVNSIRETMEAVSEFRYLGRVLTVTDDDWPEVAGNIKKARRSWGRLDKVQGMEGAYHKVSRTLYIINTGGSTLRGRDVGVDIKNVKGPGHLSGTEV